MPGTYTWTWGTGADQSFTLDIVNAVPEPAALGMFGFGVLLIGAFVGLRRRMA
ncbi:MAG: PEP-CTERM sorting domain-containing protein [Rhodanobacteraceae bacterium]